jgi:hypothetical protein
MRFNRSFQFGLSAGVLGGEHTFRVLSLIIYGLRPSVSQGNDPKTRQYIDPKSMNFGVSVP